MRKLILAAALPALLAGCYVAPQDPDYLPGPPAPQYVVVDQRPGYLWIDGHWGWYNDRWAWADGYYVVDRPGYLWVGGGYHGRSYYPGHWSPRPGYSYRGPSAATRAIQQGRTGGTAPVRTYSTPTQTYRAPVTSAPSRTAPSRAPAPAPARGSSTGGHAHSRDHR